MKAILAKYFYMMQSGLNFLYMKHPSIHWIKKGQGKTNKPLKDIPKIIWMYWDSADKNHLVDFCIYNTQEICKDYQVIILNKNNVHEYVTLPQFKKDLKVAVIADYIRLSLLKKYGGIWMDASILLSENFDWFLSKMNSTENFVFYSDPCTTNLDQPITENWFIAARPNSEFISDWLSEFEKCCLSNDPTSYYQTYKDNPLIQKIPNTDYLMCYISAAIVTAQKDYSILYANSGAVGHYYNYTFHSSSRLIALKLFKSNNKNIYIPPLVKFTSDTRFYPNEFIKNKEVKYGSLFYPNLNKFYDLETNDL